MAGWCWVRASDIAAGYAARGNHVERMHFTLMPLLAEATPRGLCVLSHNLWELCVTGAAAEGSAVDVLDFQLDRPAILVIGSEGAGVHAVLPHSSAIPSCAIYVHYSELA